VPLVFDAAVPRDTDMQSLSSGIEGRLAAELGLSPFILAYDATTDSLAVAGVLCERFRVFPLHPAQGGILYLQLRCLSSE
jgi:hypothetical protein